MATAVEVIKEYFSLKDNVIDFLEREGFSSISDGYSENEIRAKCNIHGGNNPTSFCFILDKGIFCCHACKQSGDIFTLYGLLHNLDDKKQFYRIVKDICFDYDIDTTGLIISKKKTREEKELKIFIDEYIKKKTKIENKVFDIHSIGDLHSIKGYRGLTKDILKKYGIVYNKTNDRIAFPIYNVNHEIIGVSQRALSNTVKPKWIHTKGMKTGIELYNLDNCLGKPKVTIVEGMLDCIKLYEIFGINTVAVFGSVLKEEQFIILIKNFISVDILFDNDEAGLIGAYDVATILIHTHNVRVGITKSSDPFELNSYEDIEWYSANKFLKDYKERVKAWRTK